MDELHPRVTIRGAKPISPLSLRHLRVAAYCRVSSKYDAQLNSLHAQTEYYNDYIHCHRNWSIASIFAEQMSARSMNQRHQLQAMLNLCRSGQIDLILTKSIKRFSRNTLEFLEICNELKSLGVEVYFELENLYLSNPTSVLLLTIFASLAQSESENLSADIRWGIRRGFEDGTSGFVTRPCYGYRKSINGNLTIYEPEASVVRQIFAWRMSDLSLSRISKLLYQHNIPAPKGGARCGAETLNKLLHNEKYTGSVMLQKTFVADFLDGRQQDNIGQLPKYYIARSHEPIISKSTYRKANHITQVDKKP